MKQLLPWIFFIAFIGLLITANIYLTRRFNWYFNIENTKLLYFVFPVLTAVMLFGLIPFVNSTHIFGHITYIFAAITMGVMLYLLQSVLLVDLLHFFIKVPQKFYGIAALSLTLLVSLYGMANSWNMKVTRHEVKMPGLTSEIRAMHLSDIHIGHFRGNRFLQNIVYKTNESNVDVVFITGDLFDGRINLTSEELLPLKKLKAPVYFVEGNHDRYTGVSEVKKLLREINVNVLENEMARFGDLQVIGLNHMRADDQTFDMHAAGNHSTIKGILEKMPIDRSKPSVLLHHSPDGIKYAQQNGVNLYLAGHTHAGQLFPIIYIANMIFEFNRGWHNFKGTKLFVSQGTGTFGPPMRIGTNSELALITLKPEK